MFAATVWLSAMVTCVCIAETGFSPGLFLMRIVVLAE